MSVIDDGGPAFPTAATATNVSKGVNGDSVLTNYGSCPGMSLLDWFAGQALATIPYNAIQSPKDVDAVGRYCYGIADAMLAARKAKG